MLYMFHPFESFIFSQCQYQYSDVGGQGHRKSGQLCLVLVRPDRQTTDSVFSKIPDRIRTADRIEIDRIRTDRHRTENPDRIRTADRHRTRFSGKSGQKRDKDRTRTELSADVWFKYSRRNCDPNSRSQGFIRNYFHILYKVSEVLKYPDIFSPL